MIFLFVLRAAGWPPASSLAQVPAVVTGRTPAPLRARHRNRSAERKGCAVAAQPSGKAAPDLPRYLHTAEVADILHVSPKTVSRWAKEGKLPFLKTLGGHRRYPAAEIRQLADELQAQSTA
jgi:excisionase family DNA binding protein